MIPSSYVNACYNTGLQHKMKVFSYLIITAGSIEPLIPGYIQSDSNRMHNMTDQVLDIGFDDALQPLHHITCDHCDVRLSLL